MNKLNEIDTFTFQKLAELLFETVPEFHEYCLKSKIFDDFEVGGYSFMNEFSIRLANEINTYTSSDFISHSFTYINLIGTSKNLEVLNILKVGILEILFTSGQVCRDYTSTMLNSNVQILFNDYSRFYS